MPAATPDPFALLDGLYRQQRALDGDPVYIAQHSAEGSIRRQLAVFERYAPLVDAGSVVLDWGCRHAPDSCLLRDRFGADIELHGCDFFPAGSFPPFHDHAGLEYRVLEDSRTLPYDDEAFDVVIGSGVIEHTANDSVALRELHRVMREEALLVLSFIPNRLSYTEFLGRRLDLAGRHSRLYGAAQVRRLVLHHGFVPVEQAYHQVLPAHRVPAALRGVWRYDRLLERTWPVNRFATNLMLICRRRAVL